MRTVLLLAGCLLVAGGCRVPRRSLRSEATARGPALKVGLGGRFTITFSESRARCPGGTVDPFCLPDVSPSAITDVRSEDPGIAIVERVERTTMPTSATVYLRAVAPGTTTVRAGSVALTGVAGAEQRVEVLPVTRVTARASSPCGDAPSPWRLSVGGELVLSVEHFHGAERLAGWDYAPAHVAVGGGFTAAWDERLRDSLHLRAGATPGSGALTSPTDPSLRHGLVSVDASAVEALEVSLTAGRCGVAQLAPVVQVQGGAVCWENLARSAVIETPEVCSFSEARAEPTSVVGRERPVFARRPGECRVRVKVDGTRFEGSARVSFAACTGLQPEPFVGSAVGLHGSAPDNVWAVNERSLAHFDGTAWRQVEGPVMPVGYGRNPARLAGVWTSGPGDVWVFAPPSFVAHYDGARWAVETLEGVTGLSAIAGSGPTDVWVSGHGVLARYGADRRWTVLPAPQAGGGPLVSTGPGVVVGGSRKAVFRHDGARLEVLRSPGATALWSAGPGALWAGSHSGLLHRFDGRTWTRVSGFSGQVTALCGASATDGWAVENGQRVLRFDGKAWAPLPEQSGTVRGCWAADAERVYLFGDGGVLRFRR